jgi:triosephosphate isomerase
MIVGNWKMHKTIQEALQFLNSLLKQGSFKEGDVYLAPSYLALAPMAEMARKMGIQLGVQTISSHTEGAYTGEVSAVMAKEAGASFSLIGHSERRRYFHETGESISQKIRRCIEMGLSPVVCIGETESERAEHKTKQVIEKQLKEALQGFKKEEIASLCIAYEPVWAIGTGKTATAESAQEVHSLCREFISTLYGDLAKRIPILYGGSVNVNTIKEIIQKQDIDGVLVGGASLDVESFSKIITISRECKL